MNSFHMMLSIRENIGERFQADDDHFLDNDILRKMNVNQNAIARILSLQAGADWLVTSTTLTPSDSKITIPSDCVRPVYLIETTDKTPIPMDMTVRTRAVSRAVGSSLNVGRLEAYLEDDYIVVNKDSYSTGVTLWYEKRIPNLSFGVISSGSASTLAMDAGQNPSLEDDYYNGVTVETMGTTNYEIKVRSTVSDYVGSTMTMTVTGTPTTSDYYGTISLLPEEADELLILETTCQLMARPGTALDPKYFQYWENERRRARKDFTAWAARRVSATQRVQDTGDDN